MESYSGANFLQPGHGGPGPRADQWGSRCTIKGSQVSLSLLSPGIIQHGINMFFSSCRKSSLCRRKVISSPFGAGKKTALSPPFPAALSHVCLPKFPCSLPANTPGRDRVRRSSPGAPAGAWVGAAAVSQPLSPSPCTGKAGLPAPCLRFLHTLHILSAAWPVPTCSLHSQTNPCPSLKFKAHATSSGKPSLS